jgi:ABC-2 type transport system permease protein
MLRSSRASSYGFSWTPLWGICEREVRRFLSFPIQTFGVPFITSFLYFTIFTLSFSKNAHTPIDFSLYLISGLMAMEAINASLNQAVFSLIIAKYNHTLVDILLSPIKPIELCFSYALASFLRSTIIATLILLAGMIYTQKLILPNFSLLIFTLLITSALFSSISVMMGFLFRSFEQMSLITFLIIQPLIFLSGIFFSFQALPLDIQFLKYANPIFYIVSLFRFAIIGSAEIPLLLASGASLGLTLILMGSCYAVVKRGAGVKS